MTKSWWKWARAMTHWVWHGVRRDPFEWVAVSPDTEDYTEPWNWKTWQAVRPHWSGWMRELPCGCARRLGRVVLYNMACEKHSGFTRS